MRHILPLFLALALTACAGAVPGNPQGYAGITHVDAEWKPDGDGLARVRVWQGKEGESFDIVADLATKRVEWRGKNVRAFEAFKSRADVERYVSETASDAVTAVMPGVVDLIAKIVGVP